MQSYSPLTHVWRSVFPIALIGIPLELRAIRSGCLFMPLIAGKMKNDNGRRGVNVFMLNRGKFRKNVFRR